MPDSVTLRDGRHARLVPADAAGEWALSTADGLIARLEEGGSLSWRQATAAQKLAALYGAGGGRLPYLVPGGGTAKEEAEVARAREEFTALLRRAPRRCRWPLVVLAMGEAMAGADALALWQAGLSAVADALRLAPEG